MENFHVINHAAKLIMLGQSFDSNISGSYEISRPSLHLRKKKQHLKLITGMREFAEEIISKNTIETMAT